jgi:hypothetical protein
MYHVQVQDGGGVLTPVGGSPGSAVYVGANYLMRLHQCRVVNYGVSALTRVRLPLRAVYAEAISRGPGMSQSGAVIREHFLNIQIPKIDPGASNPFVFYLVNFSRSYVQIYAPASATATVIGESVEREIPTQAISDLPLETGGVTMPLVSFVPAP